MKIYSWNVNGLRAISKKNFFEWMNNENPDILCVQEIKLQQEQLDTNLLEIKGYNAYFSFAKKKGYSGVATYSKFDPLTVRHGIGIEEFDTEGRILITDFERFSLLNVYFPNGQMSEERLNYKWRFNEALLNFCNEEVANGKKLLICGDYNIAHTEMDIKNAKANENTSGFLPIERAWVDKLINSGYTDTFRFKNPDKIKYSWWSYMFRARERNTGWRVDYHFVSNNLLDNVKNALILNNVFGSDHCPIEVELDFK